MTRLMRIRIASLVLVLGWIGMASSAPDIAYKGGDDAYNITWWLLAVLGLAFAAVIYIVLDMASRTSKK